MKKKPLKTRVPQQKRSIETRGRILEAARALFCRNGYNGTNAKEITAEAGVSVGSFYAYFKDKKELFMEITHGHMKKEILALLDRIRELPEETKRKKETIRNMIQVIVETHDQSPELYRETEVLKFSDPDILAFHEEIDEYFNRQFINFLKRHEDRLRIDDIEAAVKVIACSVQKTIHSARLFDGPINETRLSDELADMIHRYLFK